MPKKWLNGSGKLETPFVPVLDILGPDIAKAFSEVMGKLPYVERRHSTGKGNGTWQKGGLIKGKPKLAKRGC